ncbi:MAG: translocation/assembly module TamB domain-containing protein, partial [Bacteroidales bacterium]|nr:translocation/assembly module TamB domain-containing protein [Bacteroidales bacterium]
KRINLPASLASLHSNQLTGKFKGTLDDFTANLALASSVGNVQLEVDADSDADNMMACSANVSVDRVNAGRFLQSDIVGPVSLTAKLDGKFASPLRRDDFLETADVKLHAFVRQCYLKSYPLQNVNVDASYRKKNGEATVLAMDENVQFAFEGTADFSGELPQYIGELKVDKLAAGAVFAQSPAVDSVNSTGFDKFVSFAQRHQDMNLSLGLVKANITGNTLDNLSGVVMLDTVVYTQDGKNLQTNTARLIAANVDDNRKYRFTSDILNAYFSTNYEMKSVVAPLYDAAYSYFPNLLEPRATEQGTPQVSEDGEPEEKFVTAEVETFAIHRLLSFIYPEIVIAPRTQLYFHLSSDTLKDSLFVDCAFFELRNVLRVKNLSASSKEKGKNNLGIAIYADTITIPGEKKNFSFSDIDFLTNLRCNAVDYDLKWRNPPIISDKQSWLAGTFETRSKDYFSNVFTGSKIYVKNYLWRFNRDNNISYHSGDIEVDNLLLKSAASSIKVDGKYTKKDGEPLVAEIDNVDISILNSFINGESMKFDGALTAELSMVRKSGKLLISGKALADNFEFNDTPFGNVSMFALVPSGNRFGFIGGIFDEGDGATKENFSEYTVEKFRSDLDRKIQRATLMGGYIPDRKEFSVKAMIETLDLDFLKPFLASFSHRISGDASGELSFIFTPDSAYFDGTATVRHGELGIKALNTVYSLDNQTVYFNSKGIELNNIQAKDKYDNVAYINGYIHHKMFKDMKMKIDVSTKRLLALNTPKSQDMLFYGDGFVGGDVSIVSDGQKMKFTSNNLVTQQGTNFVLPIYFNESTSESEVISFKKSAQTDQAAVETEPGSMELDFDFNFQVTQDAMIQLELDPSIGGLMKARVAGPFRLIYNATSGLALNGELAIQSGTFRLTLKDIIDKMLTLQPGGKINFLGPLDNATVNVSGIYKTTASLNEVIPQELSGGSLRRTPVNAYMNLTGPLFNPNVDFSFELPNSTNEISTLFFSALDTSGIANRTQQFFSLLVLGKFQTDNITTSTSDVVTSAVEYTGMELLTNTLNNFISKNLKYVNVGINYRNADDTHAEEYSVSASTSLYNDRIVIEGSFGYANDKNKVYNNGNNFIGDYSIEYALNEQKNWRVKVFNVTNQYSSLTQTSPYAQGVALIYKQEFNNGQDWKDSWKRSKKKKKDEDGEKEKKKKKGDRK